MVERERGPERRSRRRAGPNGEGPAAPPRAEAYRRLVNPFPPLKIFSEDQVEAIHLQALRVLEEIGIRVLLPEARARFAAAGARVDEPSQMVRLDRGLVEQALATAPRTVELHAGSARRDVTIGANHVAIGPVSGPPHVTDLERGKRPGTLADFQDLVRLAQAFDVIHLLGPSVEPQDLPPAFRHIEMTRAQLGLSDKVPFVYARGRPQVMDGFALLRLARGLSESEFRQRACCYTVINTNSPLQLDKPMSQGIIDFAEWGQLLVITPFTLAGAMAPITITGALSQQHAEALAGIALAQIVRPGAPVAYGGFTSNVDMRSGSPAFGTPEYVKAAFGAGQLARRIGLPWRSSNANASNAPDAQAVWESAMSLWGALMGGCNILMHGAGWLEGGLSASLEKFILDIEMLQIMAELFRPVPFSEDELGFEAIKEVGPGGHYFAAAHTMARYQTAFYAPLVADWRNFGQWSEDGARTATERAHGLWKKTLAEFTPPALDEGARAAVEDFAERRKAEGGALPES